MQIKRKSSPITAAESLWWKNQAILSKTENKARSLWSSPTQEFTLKTLAYVTVQS